MANDLVPIHLGPLAAAREAERDAANSGDQWMAADAVAERWLREPHLADGTRDQYRLIWRSWWTWCRGIQVPPFEIERPDFTAFTDALLKIGNPAAKKPRPIGRREVARRMAVISSYYDYAIDDGKTERNPVPRKRPKVTRDSRQPHLSSKEIRALIVEADEDQRSSALVALLVLACLRVSEALNANVEDVRREVGHHYIWVRRKGDKSEQVFLPPQAHERLVPAMAGRKTGPILLAPEGGRLDRKSAWTIMRKLGARAGISVPIGPHTMRHAYITRGHELEIPVDQLQTAAGHAHVDTTRGYDRSKLEPEKHPSTMIAEDLAGPPRPM